MSLITTKVTIADRNALQRVQIFAITVGALIRESTTESAIIEFGDYDSFKVFYNTTKMQYGRCFDFI